MKSLYPSKFAMKHGHRSPLPLPGQDDRQHLHNRSACMDVPVVDVAVVASCGYTIHARFRGVDSDSFVAIKDVGSDSVFVVRWRMLSRPGPSHFKKRSGWAKHANYKHETSITRDTGFHDYKFLNSFTAKTHEDFGGSGCGISVKMSMAVWCFQCIWVYPTPTLGLMILICCPNSGFEHV